MKPLACVMEFYCSLCSMKIPTGFRLQACAHVDVCTGCMCACASVRPVNGTWVFFCESFQARRSVVFHWGKSTPSISCHVWLPSVVTDNTMGSTTANWPINGLLANGMMVARHATLALTNQNCFTGRNLARECAKRYRLCSSFFQIQNFFLSIDWKCQTFLRNAGGTFTELIYSRLFLLFNQYKYRFKWNLLLRETFFLYKAE